MADPQHATDEGRAAAYYDLPSTGLRKMRPVCVGSQATRFFRYEFFTAIKPSRNVNKSQPCTSTGRPSGPVPVNTHSLTPRSPTTKWVGLRHWASVKGNKNLPNAKPNLVWPV